MAAIIPDGGWGGPHQDPPSIMPGPSNPWAMCTDTGDDPFISNEELGESPLPLMGEPAWPKQPCSGGLWFIGVGLTITGVPRRNRKTRTRATQSEERRSRDRPSRFTKLLQPRKAFASNCISDSIHVDRFCLD